MLCSRSHLVFLRILDRFDFHMQNSLSQRKKHKLLLELLLRMKNVTNLKPGSSRKISPLDHDDNFVKKIYHHHKFYIYICLPLLEVAKVPSVYIKHDFLPWKKKVDFKCIVHEPLCHFFSVFFPSPTSCLLQWYMLVMWMRKMSRATWI